MCFDRIEMISREYGKINCSPIVSQDSSLRLSPIDGDTGNKVELLGASGPYGSITHREVRNGNYSLWHSRYIIRQDMTLTISAGQPSLALSFVLKSDIHYRLDGFPEDTMLEQQYNLIYIPSTKCEYAFVKGQEYELFGIHYTPDYPERWKHLFPPLNDLLDKANNNIPAMISSVHPMVTPAMKPIIRDIIQCMYEDPLRKMWLEAKGLELLEASLKQVKAHSSRFKKLSLSETDLDKIKQVRRYLLKHLDSPGTLKSLAHEVGTNMLKLKTGFKLLYGVTVFEFLRGERMQKAMKLLLDSDMPVNRIATLIGYKNHANFTAVFKKKYGRSPRAVRNDHKIPL
jgi:AraC-like DNA-binding protein